MDELSSLLSSGAEGPSRVTAACNWKEGKNGGYVWHWRRGRIHTLRSSPPKLMYKSGDAGPWRNLLDAPFELSTMLRELARDDAVQAGLAKRTDGPRNERPLSGPYREHRRAAMRRFFHDVAAPVRAGLQDGWCDGSWPLFRFLCKTPAALELLATPDGAAVCWGLANLHVFLEGDAASHALRRARRQLSKKRHEILGLFQLPATKAALKALAKVPRRDLGKTPLLAVREIVATPELATRGLHLPVWNHLVLEVLTPTMIPLLPHVSPALLLQVSTWSGPEFEQGSLRLGFLLRDTVALVQQQGLPLPVFASLEHLQTVHDEALQASWSTKAIPWWSPTPFPPLPITLSPRELDSVTPLLDSATLLAEGKTMHHCLGTMPWHHDAAAAGHFYAFALTKPERFTVAVIRGDGAGPWSFYDVKGPANASVSPAAMEVAEALLQRFQRSAATSGGSAGVT